MRSTKQQEKARRFLDWVTSEPANEIYRQHYGIVPTGDLAGVNKNYPSMVIDAMIYNDFENAAWRRDKILGEWQARYDAKAGKKF